MFDRRDGDQAIPAIDLALMTADLVADDFDGAEARARRLLDVPQPHTLALVRDVLGRIALAKEDATEAAAQARELEAVAQQTGSAPSQCDRPASVRLCRDARRRA